LRRSLIASIISTERQEDPMNALQQTSAEPELDLTETRQVL